MPTKRSRDVGYKSPPREHCWHKGQSGNPSGRPKGHRNLAAALTAVLGETTLADVNGNETAMTKLEAAIRQLIDKALDGDTRTLAQLFAEIHKNEAQMERENSAHLFSEADQHVLKALYARLTQDALARRGKKK